MGGLLAPLGDVLVGQHLAQPGMLVVHGPFPFLQLSCFSSDLVEPCCRWPAQDGLAACPPNPAPAIRGARRFPIFGRWFLTAAVSLRPVTRDNPGEMGGRVASPTFVGRIEELRLLEAARVRAADGDPAVVLVGGEAGVGKTRLIAELSSRCVADGTRCCRVAVCRSARVPCPTPRSWRPCGPCLPTSARTPCVILSALPGQRLPACCPPWVSRTAPVLPDQAAQARLFELLLGLFGRLSEQAPLVLVVEDLHWADQSTRDLLAFLVRNLRRERVLLVVTYRIDEPRPAAARALPGRAGPRRPGPAPGAAPPGPGPDGRPAHRDPGRGPSRRPGGERVRPLRGQSVLHRGAAGGRAGRLAGAAGDLT